MAKILIVDDKPNNLFALENVLNRLDVDMIKASSGNDALRATLHHEFALAVLDVQMPEMDGYELARLLRLDERTRRIPIIFLSAVYSDEPNIFRGYESGGVDFLTKPFNPEVLLSKVRIFLELNEQKQKLEQSVREVLRKNALIEGTDRVRREAIVRDTEEEVAGACLEVARELTASRYGIICEITGRDLPHDNTMSVPGRMLACYGLHLCGTHIEQARVKVLEDRKSCIINEPVSQKIPEAHSSIMNLLCVPLSDGDRIFGMICLAGREGGYSDCDAEVIEPLAVALVEALLRKRMEKDLRDARCELESRVQLRTEELASTNEALRLHIARVESINQELQEFAFIASHDLQEPLRKIRTFGDMLKRSNEHSLSEIGKDYLLRMENAAKRMQDLIRDLLKYSRVASGPDSCDTNLNAVAEEVAQIFEVRIKQAGGRVEFCDLPEIEADPTQMKQLFQNLIGNGLKFQQNIGVKPLLRIRAEPHGPDKCRIFFEDNGIGFDEMFLDRIFAPFKRLHNKSEYAGTGMGLAICRKIVERHGGSITAQSRPGEGSVFMVTLPLKQVEKLKE
ncbi:putative Multi-sensor signal transduction histidine kinase [Syntrophobacter sp. SbD1]|nr:putative Multi-sensor signal transduction histidine kinase [Syntrophobacter sp. SbD1]